MNNISLTKLFFGLVFVALSILLGSAMNYFFYFPSSRPMILMIYDLILLSAAIVITALISALGPKKTAAGRKFTITYFISFGYAVFTVFTFPRAFVILMPALGILLGYSIISLCGAEKVLLVLALLSISGYKISGSIFTVLMLLPAGYFFGLTVVSVYTKGIAHYLAFLFPARDFDDEEAFSPADRLKLLKWWSFIYNGKLFHDEQCDLNLDYEDVKNVKSPSDKTGKNLKKSDIYKNQSVDKLSEALSAIKRRDGNFSYETFITRAHSVFKKIHAATYADDFSEVEYLISDSLAEQLKHMSLLNSKKNRLISVDLVINDLQIAQVNTDKNFDVLHLFVRAVSYDYAHNGSETALTPEKIKKAKKTLIENPICEYYTFIRKPSALTKNSPGLLEGQCPNCGTPIQIGQSTLCPVCKSFLRSGSYDWVLTKITPASAWKYTEPENIPGYKQIIASDPNFSLQQIEDRAGVTYWLFKAHSIGTATPLKRLTSPHFYNNFLNTPKKPAESPKNTPVSENVSLKAIKIDGHREKCYSLVNREVYVMSRDTGSKTPAESTLSSIHCSNCGGPLASSLDVTCTFCGSRINDGSEWLLEKIIKEFDQEYLTVVHPNLNKPDATKQPTPLGQKPQNELIMISAQVLMADGRIDDSEMKLLQTIAQKHNVSDAELNEIIENIRQGLVFVPVPAGGTVASLGLIRDAAKMAAADGEISPDEIEAIMNLGYQLGYTKFDVKTIINKELTILKNKS